MNIFKSSILLTGIAISLLTLQSCEKNCIHGEGSTVTQMRNVGNFSEISFSTEATVYFTQDSVTSFQVEAQQNIIDDMITEIHGSELEIYNDHCIKDHAPIIIHITSPNITAIKMSGVGDIITSGKIYTNQMDLSISGSGNIQSQDTIFATSMSDAISGSGSIKLLAVSTSMNSTISGSGDISMSGSSDSHSLNISGSGSFKGYGFITNSTNVTISGSGDAELFVNSVLDVTISGSGNVYYKGQPIVTTHVSGSGNVIHTP